MTDLAIETQGPGRRRASIGAARRLLAAGGDATAERLLPPARGIGLALGLVVGVLAFAAMVALLLVLAGGRLAGGALGPDAASATLSLLAEEAEVEAQARAALEVLRETEGIRGVRVIEVDEQRDLLAPWLGTEVPVEGVTLPLMIDVTVEHDRLDVAALRARLAAAAPAAVFDDHGAWRAPVAAWGGTLQQGAAAALVPIALALAAAAALATQAAMGASRDAVAALAMIGARDRLLVGTHVRRAGRVAAVAGALGTLAAVGAAGFGFPAAGEGAGAVLPLDTRLVGAQWLLPPGTVLAVVAVAMLAARWTARRFVRRGL
jgi:cell division transport system permease protein